MAYPLIKARHYTWTNGRKIDVIVIHTMENDEKPEGAENVARWFAGETAPQASAHYLIDNNSIVQGVLDKDVAWAAPGANHNGLQFEHAGRAGQSASEWQDPYSKAMLALSVKLAAEKCRMYNIPAVWLTINDLKAGARGITSHNNVSKAFGRSTHWDPGPNFPHDSYVAQVKALLTQKEPAVAEPSPPWAAYVGTRRIGTGKFWPPTIPFIRAISRELRAGREVILKAK